jgi:hypothetical protein
MKCKEIQERLHQGLPDDAVNQRDLEWLTHLDNCPQCKKLIHDLNFVRLNLAAAQPRAVPDALDQQVLRRCHDEIDAGTVETLAEPAVTRWLKIPPLIWAAISILVVLTFAAVTPIIGDLLSSEPLSDRGLFTLIVIGQNALMLLLSPVIIQKFTQNRTNRSQLFNKFSLQNGSGDPLS